MRVRAEVGRRSTLQNYSNKTGCGQGEWDVISKKSQLERVPRALRVMLKSLETLLPSTHKLA